MHYNHAGTALPITGNNSASAATANAHRPSCSAEHVAGVLCGYKCQNAAQTAGKLTKLAMAPYPCLLMQQYEHKQNRSDRLYADLAVDL